jgi:hypothetical protein
LRVKANKGAARVDEQSITEFERNLKGNFYKLSGRLSAGSYFPARVREVQMPKRDGSLRAGIGRLSEISTDMLAKALALSPRYVVHVARCLTSFREIVSELAGWLKASSITGSAATTDPELIIASELVGDWQACV